MRKSIIEQREHSCFLCGCMSNIERHHIMFGVRFRQKADKLGLWVWLCAEHHKGNYSPHQNRDVDLMLKRTAQKAYEEKHTRDEWMSEFGRNYL